MGKRKNRSKRSLGSLPKGIPHKKAAGSGDVNPFEFAGRHRGPKHLVHNRHISNQVAPKKNEVGKRRSQQLLQQTLLRAKKANTFVDRRIGEYNQQMTAEEQNLARLVRERTRRSKKSTKYNLEDRNYNDEGMLLTHRGKVIDDEVAAQGVLLSDDEDDEGNLDAMDTALHFGGGGFNASKESAYGPSGGMDASMSQNYTQRKTELDDLILRRKMLKAEKIKAREQQEDAIADLDGAFHELTSMLKFRDKEQEIRKHIKAKREGKLDHAAQEMEDWDKEIREYNFLSKRAKATDRTKTAEELAKEEAERLHELETRRLARMNGDFSGDDFSDVSDDEDGNKRSRKKRKKSESKTKVSNSNPEKLDDSDDENDDGKEELKPKFTADGIVYVNKHGEIVKRMDDEDENESGDQSNDSEVQDDDKQGDEDSDTENQRYDPSEPLRVGTRVQGNYRAKEQFEDREHWYDGCISKINVSTDGAITYNVDYDDGDFEEDMEPENVRPIKKSKEETDAETQSKAEESLLKRKRQKAREKASQAIPFVFEVPTTLDALHAMVAKYASKGSDVSLIIQRIHASNSVKLDRRNSEKMQNFYDVLLRRFIAVGDAIYSSGDGGSELGRYDQLDALTKVLFQMTQDSPDCAAAVWGRRLGILQNAHAKRLRDAEFERDEGDFEDEELSAWPSVGTLLLLRVVGHLFPVTDRRHNIVTPVILFLGELLAQTPILSLYDLTIGTLSAGLLVQFTQEARRVAPEAINYLAGVIKLFAMDDGIKKRAYALPTLEAAADQTALAELRSLASSFGSNQNENLPSLSFEKEDIVNTERASTSVLVAALRISENYAKSLAGSLETAEREVFSEITNSLLCLKPKNKSKPLSLLLQAQVKGTASVLSQACKLDKKRVPLMRRSMPSVKDTAVKSLAPRLEDPDKYSRSKDKGKSAEQVAADRTRREYKREHKAVARELRLDAAFIEQQRRKEEELKTSRARAERQKNFAWLEGEQAAMNQQVRQGGGLLKGGGIGAAKSKAKSAKLGIKKGGKF